MVTIAFFDQVAKFTKKCFDEDWVVEKFGNDSDGTTKKVRYFKQAFKKLGRDKYPGCRHQANKKTKKFSIMPDFILCWVASPIIKWPRLLEGTSVWRYSFIESG